MPFGKAGTSGKRNRSLRFLALIGSQDVGARGQISEQINSILSVILSSESYRIRTVRFRYRYFVLGNPVVDCSPVCFWANRDQKGPKRLLNPLAARRPILSVGQTLHLANSRLRNVGTLGQRRRGVAPRHSARPGPGPRMVTSTRALVAQGVLGSQTEKKFIFI